MVYFNYKYFRLVKRINQAFFYSFINNGLKFRSYLLDQNYSKAPQKTNQQVKGVDTKELSNSIREGIQSNINNLKTQAQNLDVAEIATSSPQVQKIINDLKSLQDLPKSQLKSTCERICSGL
ncbi:MAG: hypothetical protein HYT06_01940 [Candidatus Levybacteria bacterium]|nr:hypothetical protein [Candidatus Levybacteria bacterium]